MKRFKEPKSGTPPTSHLPLNKTKVFGVESEILINYKRIKWTPRVKASLLSSQGDKNLCFNVNVPVSEHPTAPVKKEC